ncbi:hypothetical protein KP509_27G033200 [Ceratopteris richardii]|uniref:Biogenesis of lysosome-related organelles complex 1 subunit 7 n=1 Tax=Ceratopteris richardii TaxID=49495 RepID=A0A8T2RHV3_CERRI|nr:hypothetical protein KP509_27G033200 [Ceratopteris richardii]KAH7295123.1 hypothetical protein KP509_27G033200 [Ceratopteris richardii]
MTENAGDDAGLSTASIENCDGHTSAVEEDESKKDSHLDGNPDDRYDENVLVTNADGMQASEEIDTKQCVMKEVTKPIEEAKELKVSETNLNHGFVEETLADEANVKEPIISSGNSEAAKRDLDVDVLARGIASVMGPVMNSFDAGVEGALKSQSVLASSIDRLMRELDKLLEDAPHPHAVYHATRLAGIQKRVVSLSSTIHIIQKRMDMIQRLLAGYASRVASKANQQSPRHLVDGSQSSSCDIPLRNISTQQVSSWNSDQCSDNVEYPVPDDSKTFSNCESLPSRESGSDGLEGNPDMEKAPSVEKSTDAISISK